MTVFVHKSNSLLLIVAMTLGGVVSYGNWSGDTECHCAAVENCACCSARAKESQSPKYSCCGGEETPRVCRCHHEKPIPAVPTREKRENVPVVVAVVSEIPPTLIQVPTSIRLASRFTGIDLNLTQMTHARRLSLLCTWVI